MLTGEPCAGNPAPARTGVRRSRCDDMIVVMSRVAARQADLFAVPQPDLFGSTAATSESPAPAPPLDPPLDPVAELTAILARLRATDGVPYPTVSAAVAEEYHVLALAREAGPEGARLAAAIIDESERRYDEAEAAARRHPACPSAGYPGI